MKAPASADAGALRNVDQVGRLIFSEDTPPATQTQACRIEYVLAELRCASLRARLWQADIDAIGQALKVGLITPEQAVEDLHDCDCLRLIGAVWEDSA